MLWGILFSIIAGMAMSVQGVMNTRLGEGIGNMEANAFVQGSAFALALLVLLFYRQGSFAALGQVSKLYWLGGVLGLVITLTVMLGIKSLGTTLAISVILISQLLIAALIDAFGLMGSEKIAFGWNKYVGLALMTGGMLLFKTA
ncbi:MAG: DMT family transporter [Oscillospiraceae bacterium]|nr:DMT family transporter [Oscillospiraceae bacterium]